MALAASLITAAAIAFTATGPAQMAALLLAIAVMGMGGHSSLILITASVANAYPVEIRATALGWSTGTGRLGAIVSPWLGGAMLAAGVDPTMLFWTFSASSLSAALIVTVLLVIDRPGSGPVRTPGQVALGSG
jgi:AAHS family benzoate transporter-like MFS transporter